MGWAEQGIRDCQVILLGFKHADVQVLAGGDSAHIFLVSGDDLSAALPSSYEGELSIKVTPEGGNRKVFTIYCRALPSFKQNDLDTEVAKLQAEIQMSREIPDLAGWRSRVLPFLSPSPLETRYVNGFFEYTLGVCLERENKRGQAKEHLEEAFGLLWPFCTDLAHTAQCILGLKMNCFAPLQRCSQTSPFAPADAFFNQRKAEWGAPSQGPVTGEHGVYVDDFTIAFLRAVTTFYRKEGLQIERRLAELRVHPGMREKNNEDKVHLLAARHMARSGDIVGARAEYDLLKYHPLFGAEAKDFLK